MSRQVDLCLCVFGLQLRGAKQLLIGPSANTLPGIGLCQPVVGVGEVLINLDGIWVLDDIELIELVRWKDLLAFGKRARTMWANDRLA